MPVADRLVRVRFLPTQSVHLVYAAGGPADGSLYGFQTLCERTIENIDNWQEGDFEPTCKLCLRIRDK